MSDLISREQAIDVLIPIVKSASLRNRNVYSVAKKCMSAIEELPSAQPEQRWISCGDCKHYKIDHPRANGYHCCYRMHSIFPMKPDDFCSYGERRTE